MAEYTVKVFWVREDEPLLVPCEGEMEARAKARLFCAADGASNVYALRTEGTTTTILENLNRHQLRLEANRELARTMMTDGEFWSLVAEAEWNELRDAVRAKERLKIVVSEGEWEGFAAHYWQKFSALYVAFNDWLKATSTPWPIEENEDVTALLSHVLGCGRQHYEVALRRPYWLHYRARHNDYAAGFDLAVPHYGMEGELLV